jgi:hypothetical protein
MMPFEVLLRSRLCDPTDSWELHRVDSKELRRVDSKALVVTASVEAPAATAGGQRRLRKTNSLPLGAGGESQERGPARRRVGFSPSFLNSAHDVTPYGNEYGVHPSFFNFGRSGTMWLTDSGVAENIRRKEEGLEPLMLDGKELL